jgi:hypothetical protein
MTKTVTSRENRAEYEYWIFGTPPPSPAGVCGPPPLVPGGDTLLAGEGMGGPNTDKGTDTVYFYFIFLCSLWKNSDKEQNIS